MARMFKTSQVLAVIASVFSSGSNSTATAGSQVVNCGGGITSGSDHELPDVWEDGYGFRLVVNGGANQDIVITEDATPTYAALIAAINAQITGAVASISGGNIKFTSSTTGASSSIVVSNTVTGDVTALFPAISGYSAISTAVAGMPSVKVSGTEFAFPPKLNLDTYANEAAAVAAGLAAGTPYKTATGELRVKL